jgi:hypothetical protein
METILILLALITGLLVRLAIPIFVTALLIILLRLQQPTRMIPDAVKACAS